jgi:hypothetical protein
MRRIAALAVGSVLVACLVWRFTFYAPDIQNTRIVIINDSNGPIDDADLSNGQPTDGQAGIFSTTWPKPSQLAPLPAGQKYSWARGTWAHMRVSCFWYKQSGKTLSVPLHGMILSDGTTFEITVSRDKVRIVLTSGQGLGQSFELTPR